MAECVRSNTGLVQGPTRTLRATQSMALASAAMRKPELLHEYEAAVESANDPACEDQRAAMFRFHDAEHAIRKFMGVIDAKQQ